MRASVRWRQILATHKDLARKLEELEKKFAAPFRHVMEAIQHSSKRPILARRSPRRRRHRSFGER
jgi:hypothetical protein